jgi:hypothetical protein
MRNQSIAQKIANKKLRERNIIKLAFGGTAGMGSYSAPTASSAGSAPAAKAPTAASPAALPAAPKPAARGGRGAGAALPRANRYQAPVKKPNTVYTPENPYVAGAYGGLQGVGQGIKNMAGAALVDFPVAAARVIASPFAAEIGRNITNDAAGDDYANDTYNTYEKAWGDLFNSFGRYVGVHDAWNADGQYRGAQPANSAGQYLDTDITQKYFSNPADADLAKAYQVSRSVGEGAASGAAGGVVAPMAGAMAARIPGVAAVGNAVTANPITNRAINYGLGIQVGNPNSAGFIAANMGQNIAGGYLDGRARDAAYAEAVARGDANPEAAAADARSPFSRFLPAYEFDTQVRDTFGDWAPEVVDAVRMGSNAPINTMLGASATLPYAQPYVDKAVQATNDAAHSGLDQLDAYLNPGQQQTSAAFDALNTQLQANLTDDRLNSLDEASYERLNEMVASLEGKGMEERLPIMEQINALFGDEQSQVPQQTPAEDGAPMPTADGAAAAASSPGVAAAVQSLPQDIPDEQRQVVESVVADVEKNISPETKALLEKPGGIEEFNAQTAETAVDQIAQERIAQETGPENPRDWATWTSDIATWAQQTWDSLGPMGQLAFGIGLPLGVIGLLGGGLGGVLTAVLGFGAAGFAAANSGMLGETAQNTVAGATGAAASGAQQVVDSVTGGAQPPENAGTTNPEQLLLNKIINAPLTGGLFTGFNRDAPGALKDTLATNAPALMELVKKPDTDIRALFDSLNPSAQEQLLSRLTLIKDNAPTKDDPKTENFDERETTAIVNRLLGIVKNGYHMQYLNNKSASQIVAQHLAIASLQKAARCWSGYEPVPGKKPYSNDSCRPIGSKKKKKKKAAK